LGFFFHSQLSLGKRKGKVEKGEMEIEPFEKEHCEGVIFKSTET